MTYCNYDEAGDYVVPNVLGPSDLVARPDNMDETVLSYVLNQHLMIPERTMRHSYQSKRFFFYWCIYRKSTNDIKIGLGSIL